jgi:hypothetical protein
MLKVNLHTSVVSKILVSVVNNVSCGAIDEIHIMAHEYNCRLLILHCFNQPAKLDDSLHVQEVGRFYWNANEM